jgi:protein-tyrosine-phosphatase
MAEALIQHAAAADIEAQSAGSYPKSLHPNSVWVMREWGVDIGDRRAKHMYEFLGKRFDYVITLRDRVRELCPEFPGPSRNDLLEHDGSCRGGGLFR